MKMRKKVISILLAGCMAVASLSACGGGQEAETNSGVSEGVSADSQSAGFNDAGMPIVDEPVTLTVLTTRWGNMGDSFKDNPFLVELEERTNVHIEWQVQSLNDWSEQKGILLAGGELPDIVLGKQTFTDDDIMNNLEMFLPLDDLVDEYMPNYKAALEEMPELKKTATFPDGNMYSFAKNLPQRPMSCNQPVINKKWLDNLGLEIPETLDELYTVLKAFKEKDANGNGDPNDEIPISGSKGLSMDLLNPFGITDLNGKKMLVNEDGTLEYYPTSEKYKEGIKWLNKLYEEGIIDPEAFTQDDTMLSAKRQDPNVSKVGFEYAWSHEANFGKWSDEYIVIPPIKGPDGVAYTAGDSNGVSSVTRNEAMITSFCKHPEIAARWIDEFYTGEASIQNFWGGIGEVIEKNEDGTYTLNDPPEGTSADSWYWDRSLRDFGPKYVSEEFEQKIKLSPESGDGLKVELSKMADDTVTIPYPEVMFTNEESADLPTLTTDIDKFVETTRATWVTEGGVDEGWDAYIEQLNSMGLERLIEIYTDAYNRYMEE